MGSPVAYATGCGHTESIRLGLMQHPLRIDSGLSLFELICTDIRMPIVFSRGVPSGHDTFDHTATQPDDGRHSR